MNDRGTSLSWAGRFWPQETVWVRNRPKGSRGLRVKGQGEQASWLRNKPDKHVKNKISY